MLVKTNLQFLRVGPIGSPPYLINSELHRDHYSVPRLKSLVIIDKRPAKGNMSNKYSLVFKVRVAQMKNDSHHIVSIQH